MAETYTAIVPAISITPGKSLIGIFNADATKKVKIRRIHLISCQNTPAQDYYYGTVEIRFASAVSGGREITPSSHDSTNSALPDTDIKVLSAATWTDTAILRRRFVSLADATVGGTVAPVFGEATSVLACAWEGGYASAGGTQVVTLNQNEGIHVMIMTMTQISGEFDVTMEFTVT